MKLKAILFGSILLIAASAAQGASYYRLSYGGLLAKSSPAPAIKSE